MPIGIQRLNAKKSQPNGQIVFIKPLKGPDEAVAQDFLERIAAQCLPIMREHHLSVTSLEEYEPNAEFVGRNFNAGEVIQLVLKTRFTNRWLPFEYVQMVMMHELAHCRQMNHSRAFWAVRDAYAARMRELWARGYTGEGVWGRGAKLATGEFERNMATPGLDALPEHLCGGTYRSRRRRKKTKKEVLSYQEQKERRILKKFGANGVALGEDEEGKARLEGKRVAAKPRVAGSKRGRELRAAAALARFGQQQQKKEEDEDDEDIKARIKREMAEADEADSDEYEYEDEEDARRPGAVDIDGRRLLDGKGRGMVRVCGDESPDDRDAQRELLELQSSMRARQPQGQGAAPGGEVKRETRLSTLVGSDERRAESPGSKRKVKVEEGEEDWMQAAIPRAEQPAGPPPGKKIKAEPKPEPDLLELRSLPPLPPPAPRASNPGHIPGPSSSPNPDGPAAPERRPRSCPICSFSNGWLAVTCDVCSHVLDARAVPGSWRCRAPPCAGSLFLNAGDSGACGVCGERRGQV